MTAVTLHLMHDFEVWCGGEPVRMGPSSQRLLGFVALNERPVRRTRVRGVLWPDASEDRASASLRSALWRVPNPGGEPVVVATPTHLALAPHVEVDFRSALGRAQDLLAGGDHDGTAIDLARELCTYRDDLLPGWYDDWVLLERERFHHLRLQALERLAERLAAAGRPADALQVALVGIHAEPLRESMHRILMRLHLGAGNVAEAIRQYRRYEAALHDELGAAPSAVMRRLLSECLHPCQARAPEPAIVPGARERSDAR